MNYMRDIISILKGVGAIITDSHFVGTSGRHMSAYINKDALLPYTKHVSEVGKLFAEKFKNKKIEAVVAPAVGGIPLSQWTAYHLSKMSKKDVLSLYTEKTPDNNQILKRDYENLVKNKRVLVVEDTTTTGGSVKKVIRSVKKAKGRVVAVCIMVNRDPKIVNSKSIGAPFSSLGVFKVPSYEAKNCPLCKKGVPINTQLGHGKKF
ncbi:MAG: orotate phosphoribosyltransferase [Parcubacteria group bacterium Gr01-1014_24]|nr:MAG: orotate phosphoribosyltransferase [Parcubacteria group bacterium Gr01-1014_24]